MDIHQRLGDPVDLHKLFASLPIEDKCTYPGTEWYGDTLLPCGGPTVGAGMFCDPFHKMCSYYSLCERHERGKLVETWKESSII